MLPREKLIDWFKTRSWDLEKVTIGIKKGISRTVFVPDIRTFPDPDLFYDKFVSMLGTDLSRMETISVFRELAIMFPGQSDVLEKFASQLEQQTGSAFDLAAAVDMCLISEDASRVSDETSTTQPFRNESFPNELITDPAFNSIPHPAIVFSAKVERDTLFPQFLDFARKRDIVFALGGVGSGLDTFTRQFFDYLHRNGTEVVNAPDLNPDCFEEIKIAREPAEKEHSKAELQHNIHLELKCLLTALAYATYASLRNRFEEKIDHGLGCNLLDRVHFSDYYFSSDKSRAMYGGDPVPILKHFFKTVQRLAQMSEVEDVLVFMPWQTLAACFRDKADEDDKRLGLVLWGALGSMAAIPIRRSRIPYEPSFTPLPIDLYDRVCLVVCCSEVPYAHNAQQQKDLVSRYIWPIPSLDREELKRLVENAIPELNPDLAAAAILDLTGGVPWFVRLLMSYVSDSKHLLGLYDDNTQHFIAACGQAAIRALAVDGNGTPVQIGDFIRVHKAKVKEAFGNSHSTDSRIEERWAGNEDDVGEGYLIQPYRLEAFVASGLTWLKGDPWDAKREDYVFAKYPIVFLESARELPLAMYNSVMGKKVRRKLF